MQTYGDSNFLFDQSVNDISASYVEPALEGLLRASIGENDVELHLPLLRGLPHLARTGDADMTVHSFWARRAARLLEASNRVGDLFGRFGARVRMGKLLESGTERACRHSENTHSKNACPFGKLWECSG